MYINHDPEMIYIIFLAFLLKLFCFGGHVYCPSVFPGTTLILVTSGQDEYSDNSTGFLPDLFSNGKERDASVTVTDLTISFPFV